jgi:hypothetical protein
MVEYQNSEKAVFKNIQIKLYFTRNSIQKNINFKGWSKLKDLFGTKEIYRNFLGIISIEFVWFLGLETIGIFPMCLENFPHR